MNRVKPLFRYAGGKAKLLNRYAPFFEGVRPEHCVDYFGGSGTMSLWFHHLYPEAKLYLNEKDAALYYIFTCLKDDYDHFCNAMYFLEEYISEDFVGFAAKKALYYLIRQQYNAFEELGIDDGMDDGWYASIDTDAFTEEEREEAAMASPLTFPNLQEDAIYQHACYFFLRTFSFSGVNVRNKKGEYTSAAGIRSPNQPCYVPEVLTTFKAMLDHAELLNRDYSDVDIHLPCTLHYFDPPYVDTGGNLYTYRFDWEHTEELCTRSIR